MKRVSDEKVIEDAWNAFQIEVGKLESVGFGVFTSALRSALIVVQKSHPQVTALKIERDGEDTIFAVYAQ